MISSPLESCYVSHIDETLRIPPLKENRDSNSRSLRLKPPIPVLVRRTNIQALSPQNSDREFNVFPNLSPLVLPVPHRLALPSGRTFSLRILGNNTIWTTSPSQVQAILSTRFSDLELSRSRISAFRPYTGDGIFSSNGTT